MRKRLGRSTNLVQTSAPPVPAGKPLLDICFTATVEAKNEALDALLSALHETKTFEVERDEFMARLCLDEALTNAVMHGSKFDATKQVRARLFLDGGSWKALIEDQGEGFREADLPDPDAAENLLVESGRGVALMRNFMHEVSYWHGGSALLMARNCSTPAVEARPTRLKIAKKARKSARKGSSTRGRRR